MNIYHSIYCFFYKLWEKRGNDGKFSGSVHILFTLCMHLLLFGEIFHDITGNELFKLPKFVTHSKINLIIVCVPFFLCIRYYFNSTKTSELLEEYEEEYGENESKISLIILLFAIMPVILAITLSTMRHNGYF
jgi:hypothetical protein